MARRARLPALALLVALAAAARAAPDEPVAEFKKAFARATDADGRAAALRALGAAGTVDAAKLLVRLSVDPQLDWQARDAAEAALHGIAKVEVTDAAGAAVAGAKAEKDDKQRAVWAGYLAARAASDARASRLLLPALADAATAVRVAAIEGVARLGDAAAVEALVGCLEKSDGRVLEEGMEALRGLTGQRHASAVEWASWWAGARETWKPGDAAARPADDPDRFRTSTRVEPPTAGKTLYREVRSGAVLFVVDVSYSMQVKLLATDGSNPTRLDYMKEATAQAIEQQLQATTRFNVLSFSTDVKGWQKKLVEATPANKKKAAAWVRSLRLEGDTNIHDSLELAFQHPDVDTIYFLTDGTPTHGKSTIGDDILGAVRRWNAGRKVKVHTICFLPGDGAPLGVVEDKGMAGRFLRSLAEQTGGTFTLFD